MSGCLHILADQHCSLLILSVTKSSSNLPDACFPGSGGIIATAAYFRVSCSCSQSKCLYRRKTPRPVFVGVIWYWMNVFIPPSFELFSGLPTEIEKCSLLAAHLTISPSESTDAIESSCDGPGDGPMKNGSVNLFFPPKIPPFLEFVDESVASWN